jgi:DNA-binding NtrC family response regulator
MGADRVAQGVAPPWYLAVALAPAPLDVLHLTSPRTRIGRDADAGVDLVLPDPAVSGLHAILSASLGEETLWLEDCESRNGVLVNGIRVQGAALRPSDVIRLGDSILVVGRGARAPLQESGELGILGRAPAVVELRSVVNKLAPSALTVLILGATGTGKELVARALHAESGRRGRFVAVNCAALPGSLVESVLFGHTKGAFTGAVSDQDGAFVQADGGTLFLDEVGDLALDAQPKLLRALENGEVTPVGATAPLSVSVRVVSATHVPLDAALDEGRFRRDLYARIAGVVVKTPALAERREDIPLLFLSFLHDAQTHLMSADFVESLLVHDWPFNVRELRKLAERLAVLHSGATCWERGMLDGDGFPSEAVRPAAPACSSVPLGPRRGPPPREELALLLARCDGNVSRVADLVCRNRKQVYRWMKQYALDLGTGRR